MSSNIFEALPVPKLFFSCAVPAMIAMGVISLYSIVDGIFVGQFIGQDALAGVNLVTPFLMISFALSDMVAVGSSVQISILLGQKKREDANKTFTFCLKVIFISSVIMGLLGFFFVEPLLALMGAEGNAVVCGIEYLRVYAVFAPFLMLYYATDNYLRICGKQNLSMIIIVGTSVLNILLDFLFIVILHQGVWSAALASCICMSLGTGISLIPFLRNKLDLHFAKGVIPLRNFLRLSVNGLSDMFSNIAASILMIIVNIVLLAIAGTTAVAAISIVMYVEAFIASIIIGMVSSMQPAISYCYGAGLIMRVKSLLKITMAFAALLSILSLLLMIFGRELIIPLFVMPGDISLLEMSLRAMELFAFSYLVSWVYPSLSSYLTAVDCPIRSMIVSLSGALVFPVICLAVMSPILGLDGVWLMPTAAGILSAVTAVTAVSTLNLNRKKVHCIN